MQVTPAVIDHNTDAIGVSVNMQSLFLFLLRS